MAEPRADHKDLPSEDKDVKAPNIIQRAQEEVESVIHAEKSPHHHHHKETHGTSDDIDENTPIEEVKAPGVFQRVKEEIEAFVQAVLPKKDSSKNKESPSK